MLYKVLPKKIEKVFIDLDDTLVDFIGTAFKLFNRSSITSDSDIKKFWSFIEKEDNNKSMWKKINSNGPRWWKELPKLPWADRLVEAANNACSDVIILTSPGNGPGSGVAAQGKIEWSLKNFGSNELVLAYKKYMCSSPGSILIDDWDKFTVPWSERGGTALTVKRPWTNTGYDVEDIIQALNKYGDLNRMRVK